MLTVAHRGYSSAYPENTALAFEQAIAAGAELIETDVRLAGDGAPVCWHDPDFGRVAGDPRAIAALDLPALKSVPLPRGQSLLALAEVLRLARARARVLLDVKIATERALDAILAALEQTRMTGDVVYGARTLEHLRAAASRCRGLALLGMPPAAGAADDYLQENVIGIRYWEEEVTAERVRLARARGREVWVTAGLRLRGEPAGHATAERIVQLARTGVAAALVNDPALARSALAADRANAGATPP